MRADYIFIEDEAALHRICDQLKGSLWLAIDTEFEREKTFYPELCLLQVANAETTAVIDPRRFVFTHHPDTSFIVSKSTIEDEYFLDRKNFERYRRFLHFSNAVSNQQLASIYVRYYPLFQEAYEELGYPGRYFNDRVIEIIDHLLQTPDIVEPIRLIQPKVYYLFADPDIEKLSVGQKILIRIGSENAEQLKIRLKDLRSILTTLDP